MNKRNKIVIIIIVVVVAMSAGAYILFKQNDSSGSSYKESEYCDYVRNKMNIDKSIPCSIESSADDNVILQFDYTDTADNKYAYEHGGVVSVQRYTYNLKTKEITDSGSIR
jgi:hypothetical protein